MAASPLELLKTYVLHTRPWRDSSLLVDLLVEQQGRVRAIARGQRRQSSRHSGNICQPFRPLLASLSGRGELKNLSRLESGGMVCRLPGERLYAGFYVNELLLRVLPESDPHPRLYAEYQQLLAVLAMPGAAIEPALRYFECTLLEQLGYAIDFVHEAHTGNPLQADMEYQFVAEAGFVALDGSGARGGLVYPGAALLQVGRGQLESASTRAVAKQLMRQALAPLLGDKPLQSRMLYQPAAGLGPKFTGSSEYDSEI